MIKPTIGRVVLFFPCAPWPANDGKNPIPAVIAKVWSDRLINIGGFDQNGAPFNATSVILHQEGDPKPPGVHAEWMPYQIGQAKRTEIAESAAQAVREEQDRSR